MHSNERPGGYDYIRSKSRHIFTVYTAVTDTGLYTVSISTISMNREFVNTHYLLMFIIISNHPVSVSVCLHDTNTKTIIIQGFHYCVYVHLRVTRELQPLTSSCDKSSEQSEDTDGHWRQSCSCQLDPTHPPSGKRVSSVLCDISTLFISWKNGVCC